MDAIPVRGGPNSTAGGVDPKDLTGKDIESHAEKLGPIEDDVLSATAKSCATTTIGSPTITELSRISERDEYRRKLR